MNVHVPFKAILKIEQNYALIKKKLNIELSKTKKFYKKKLPYFVTFKICKKKGGYINYRLISMLPFPSQFLY